MFQSPRPFVSSLSVCVAFIDIASVSCLIRPMICQRKMISPKEKKQTSPANARPARLMEQPNCAVSLPDSRARRTLPSKIELKHAVFSDVAAEPVLKV